MCILIFEYGMPVVSWYAEFALRRRVSMSAIGSVMVMACWPSSPRFPCGRLAAGTSGVVGGRQAPAMVVTSGAGARRPPRIGWSVGLPAGLGDARQLATVGHVAEADPAQA